MNYTVCIINYYQCHYHYHYHYHFIIKLLLLLLLSVTCCLLLLSNDTPSLSDANCASRSAGMVFLKLHKSCKQLL